MAMTMLSVTIPLPNPNSTNQGSLLYEEVVVQVLRDIYLVPTCAASDHKPPLGVNLAFFRSRRILRSDDPPLTPGRILAALAIVLTFKIYSQLEPDSRLLSA
jgi:hypothetical protein